MLTGRGPRGCGAPGGGTPADEDIPGATIIPAAGPIDFLWDEEEDEEGEGIKEPEDVFRGCDAIGGGAPDPLAFGCGAMAGDPVGPGVEGADPPRGDLEDEDDEEDDEDTPAPAPAPALG